MEIATRNVIFPGNVGLAQAHPLTKPLAMGDGLPPDFVQLRPTLPIRALVLGTKVCVPWMVLDTAAQRRVICMLHFYDVPFVVVLPLLLAVVFICTSSEAAVVRILPLSHK